MIVEVKLPVRNPRNLFTERNAWVGPKLKVKQYNLYFSNIETVFETHYSKVFFYIYQYKRGFITLIEQSARDKLWLSILHIYIYIVGNLSVNNFMRAKFDKISYEKSLR